MAENNKTVLRCPHCGGSNISPDEKSGQLKCHSCKQLIDAKTANKEGGVGSLVGKVVGEGAKNIVPDEKVILTLKCSSCGAEVVMDARESMTMNCPWCRHLLSMTDKIQNGAVPDLVLPFKISREEAFKKMEEFLSDRRSFANPELVRNFNVENIRGVFLPYVVVDMLVDAKLSGMGEQLVRAYTVGSGDNEETRYDANLYRIERSFELEVDDLTIEASSSRLNHDRRVNTNNIISAIMPFDTENAVAWDPRYLRGYTSERRDLNIDELDRKAKNQTEDIMKYRIMDSIIQYDRGVCWDIMRLNQKGVKWQTAYLPVWLFSVGVKKGDRTILHYIAVNARTGETHGSVPVDMNKIIKLILGVPLALMLLNLIQSFFELYVFGFKASFALLFRPLVPIISIIWMMVTGIISIIKWRKYGDFDVRHDFETETRAKIDKLEESDELVEALHGLKNSQMRNRNDNKKTDVDGSKKRTIDGRNNSSHNLTILIIVGVIFFMMFILPFLVFMSVLLASY